MPHATAWLSPGLYVWPSRFFSRNKKEKSKVFTAFRLRSHKKCPWYWRELVSVSTILANKRDNIENKEREAHKINTFHTQLCRYINLVSVALESGYQNCQLTSLNQTRNQNCEWGLSWGVFLNILFYLSESRVLPPSPLFPLPGISGLKVSSGSGERDSTGTCRSQRDLTDWPTNVLLIVWYTLLREQWD